MKLPGLVRNLRTATKSIDPRRRTLNFIPDGDTRPHVVIVGAGFAGLAAIAALKDQEVTITLIDKHNFATFQPLLYQVATAGLNPGDVAFPVRSLLRRFPGVTFRQGVLTSLDREKKEVVLEDGESISYDYLILGFGASTNYFGVPGAGEHTYAIYALDDAVAVRNRIFAQYEKVAAHGAEEGDLTVVVIGGGATGVEMAGALAELRTRALHTDYPNIESSLAKVILIEQNGHLLSAFDEPLCEYAKSELEGRGVTVRVNETVREIFADQVQLTSGEIIKSSLIIWAAGVGVPEVATKLGLLQGRGGRIVVGGDLRAEGCDREFAVGDLAAALDQSGELTPQLAQPAIQSGAHAGAQILRLMQDLPTESFTYKDKGIMATIGRRAAVAQLRGGFDLTGTAAWIAWLALHVMFLLGVRNRLSVLLNWAWHYVSWGRGPRVILGG